VAFTGVDVTDTVDNGGTCIVTGGTDVTVPANGQVELDYTCSYASEPSSYEGTNTATATWDEADYLTPNGSADGTSPFTIALGDTVDRTVTVTDTMGASVTTLGTVTATDQEPWASKTFTYTRSLAALWNMCKDYTNTATIVETEQSSSWTVTVCGSLKTGALTIGFWQNKNGQGIIKKYCSGTSGTSLRTFLRQYPPFQDLSATATCTQIASYVYNVIKVANSAGTTMNAMLKAQMLATALDVYFSDPALGGNRIKAPAPIGGLLIDLTLMWGYLDVSGAFGGATSMTVTQMLTYAGSQSNVGGSVWYANVKSMQELAKSAFDAINNEVAFGA